MNDQYFVGIDIAAKSAAVAWIEPDEKVSASQIIAQTRAGFERLIEQLKRFACRPEQVLVVMEATGTYWMQLARALYQAHFTISVINPSQAHFFAKTQRQRTKTDAIDAQLLAQLALKLQPEPWRPPPAIFEEVAQRLSQRDSLLSMRSQQRNRLHAFRQQPTQIPMVLAQLEAHLDFLQAQITHLDQEIEALFSVEHEWGQSAQRLRSIPGLGTITTAWRLTATLNFT
jgi:transposase